MSLSLWSLGDIKTKARNLSGRLDTNDLTDASLVDYINRYYQLAFPLEVQPLELQTWFGFDISDGTATYDLSTQTDSTTSETFADGYLTVGKPFTAGGYNVNVYQNPSLFYEKWPETTTYGETRPDDVLYYDEKLLFKATPDTTYTIKFQTIKKPTAFPNSSPTTEYPVQEEWGPVIAYGAAIEIAEDIGDMETVQKLVPRHEELKIRLMRKVHDQNDYQRSIPKF